MEDVLDVYARPVNALEPVVCLDEKSVQLLKEVKPCSRLAKPNHPRKKDYEYARRGTLNAFCVVEPRRGKHSVTISKHRKSKQFSEVMRKTARMYPKAKKIHLVMDNLSTHREAALIRTFGPVRGAKIWNRFEVHYTPKHGSWLNQAEIEISMFSRQCLGKDRIASMPTITKRAAAWVERMNAAKTKIIWTFTSEKARTKFGYNSNKSPETGH